MTINSEEISLEVFKKTIVVSLLLVFLYCISTFMSSYTYNTDFPAFYRAAKVIHDRDVPNTSVYEVDVTTNKYNIPEAFVHYRFSVLIAYLMSPLALLPYNVAKAIMIAINFLAYGFSMVIILHLKKASGRWFIYPLALSFLWMPFVHDIRFVQVNSLLLFLITLSVLFASKNRPFIGGAILGLAALFKVFPIAIAMVLGIKNWRIIVSCAAIFGVALLFPGTKEWFSSFAYTPFLEKLYSVIYLALKDNSIVLYGIYVSIIGGVTALKAYCCRNCDYLSLTALAIPATLLTMPVIEYFHLVLLILTYTVFIFFNITIYYRIMAAVSFIFVYLAGFLFPFSYLTNYIIPFGLILLWIPLVAHELSLFKRFTGDKLPG